jgi:hypothetical protein
MSIPDLQALAVLSRGAAGAHGCADLRYFPARRSYGTAWRLVGDLVGGQGGEIAEHDLDNGRRPVIAAPTASPTIPASAISVSYTQQAELLQQSIEILKMPGDTIASG